jgi:hypothetical protein
MRHPVPAWAMVAAVIAAVPVHAADFDGSVPLICAFGDLQSCAAGEDCQRETASGVNLPTIVRVDVAAKTIEGKRPDGEKRTTAIGGVWHNEQGLVLQGVDAGRSWTAAIGPDGRLSVAAIGMDEGFFVFGECVTR